jgi:hypothetical protein
MILLFWFLVLFQWLYYFEACITIKCIILYMVASTANNWGSCDIGTSIYLEARNKNKCLDYIHMLNTPLYKHTQINSIQKHILETIITKKGTIISYWNQTCFAPIQSGREVTITLLNLPCGESYCTSSGSVCATLCSKHSLMRRHVLCDMRWSICGKMVYHGTRRVHTDPHGKLSRGTVTSRPPGTYRRVSKVLKK